ncbi:N-lysine methyltransferase setd6 [Linum grandiflorum]
MSRPLRAFVRWMKSQGFQWSDGMEFVGSSEDEGGVSVKAVRDLKEGEVVATIPKTGCLTVKNSEACELIESAGLGGCLGLSVALMYERSLGESSPWAGYLQLLPESESVPLLWTIDEIDRYLQGTELHKVKLPQAVKEDKGLVYEDWEENIMPLVHQLPSNVDAKDFGVDQYFAAKSLVSSRAFEIDDYHGHGMVPLADL